MSNMKVSTLKSVAKECHDHEAGKTTDADALMR